MKEQLTPENLKSQLWETMLAVRGKKLHAKEANSIATQARAICSIAKLELEFHKAAGTKPTSKKLLS